MKKNKTSLIIRYLDRTLTAQDVREFERLMLSGAIKEEELNDFKNIIKSTQKLEIPAFEPEEKRLSLNHNSVTKNLKKPFSLNIKQILKIAAILIIGITAGVVIMYKGFVKNKEYVEIETKSGDKIHITIPGGNEVWLNSRSTIRYAASFTGSSRVISLTGEAYFRFSNKQNSPLIINCAETQIICSQGSLNVENDTIKKSVEIEVEEGWVAITNPQFGDKQFIVETGFKGTINDMVPLWIEQNSDPNYLAWHTGILKFENTTLKGVAKTLSEVYDIQVNIEGEMKYCFLTKKFTKSSLESVLDELQRTLKVDVQQQNNKITITGNPC